jgi:peptide/nickel transport system ATP-binding protein
MGKTIGVVGESGCGKSVTSLSLMRLLQGPQGQIAGGQIRYNQISKKRVVDLTKLSRKEMEKIRGNEIAMIFQEPMTTLNPVFTIGYQIDESIRLHNPRMKKGDIKDRTIEMLKLVGIARAEGIYDAYPHELSGGMRQRVVIAMALSCDPQLIIADEPTTALDVTIQAQILDLLRDLKDKINASIMLITHDLGVVAEMADYVVVMYAGRIVEQGTAKEIYHDPLHPYTIGLMKSRPILNEKIDRLYSIPGNVPNPINLPKSCYFKNRCERCMEVCNGDYPRLISVSPTHKVCCYLYDEKASANNTTVGGKKSAEQ